MVPIVGGFGNGAAEEDCRWDLNPGVAAMRGLFGTTGLRREEPQTSISFSEIQYCGLGSGGQDCAVVGILKDFGISMETLSHYS